MPPDVVYDYSKCDGNGQCVQVCPVQILELSQDKQWCKAIDGYVDNKEAVEAFHSMVDGKQGPIPIKIHNSMSACLGCAACVAACPNGAIEIIPEFADGQAAVEQLKRNHIPFFSGLTSDFSHQRPQIKP